MIPKPITYVVLAIVGVLSGLVAAFTTPVLPILTGIVTAVLVFGIGLYLFCTDPVRDDRL